MIPPELEVWMAARLEPKMAQWLRGLGAMEVSMTTEAEREVRDEFDNSFDVPLTPSQAWEILSDIRRIAHSIPGVKMY